MFTGIVETLGSTIAFATAITITIKLINDS